MSRTGKGWLVALAVSGALAAPSTAVGATFEVTRFDDPAPNGCNPGDCSLREAVIAANATAAADTIPLEAETYELSIVGTSEDAAADGDLDITQGLTITGAGRGVTEIDGGGDVTGERVLHLDPILGGPTVPVELSRLTVTGGGDASTSSGGGISADNETNLTLSRAAVSGNSASSIGGGMLVEDATVRVERSVISDNTVDSSGGAIYNNGDARTTITDSTVRRNEAGGPAGGIYNNDTTVLTVRRSTISGNHSDGSSGAIYSNNDSVMTIEDSTLSGNSAEFHGGALYLQNDSVTNLINTTLSGNRTDTTGGGVHIQNDPTVTFRSTTIADNFAAELGGGVHVLENAFGGTFTIHSTLLAGNTAGDAGPDCGGESGALGSDGFNLIGDSSGCGFTAGRGDLVGRNPKLRGLKDNGGPTLTHALKNKSKAKNNVPKAQKQKQDQRGAPRKGKGDIGAYELVKCEGVVVNVVGTAGKDKLKGTKRKDGILGLGGNDKLSGKKGKDGLCGGRGKDKLKGGPGKDKLDGGPGKDKEIQ